eukprot:TRINITY_DN3885_c0_g1_i1.p1 TRINITY_DN3885_c0_g1~~TRINITY_DN3885_c0_g1_i1.p1  ORF type:complete len:220 (-),score=61.25 TRINITY_DN3885_c0_g1_i1:145-774(-)
MCKKHNVLLLSDEVHNDLIFKNHKHTSALSLSTNQNQTVVLLGPSKTFNLSGLFLSVVVIKNVSLADQYNLAADQIGFHFGNVFGLVAMETAYSHPGCEIWLKELLEYLEENQKFVLGFCEANLKNKIKPIPSGGTFLLWLDCSKLNFADPNQLEKFFLEECNVGFSPGCTFGPGGEKFMRMNLACPRATLVVALNQIYAAMKRAQMLV